MTSAVIKIEFFDRIEIRRVWLEHNLPFGKKEMERWLKDELGNDVEIIFLKRGDKEING